jgi:hypothetical protein
MPRNESDIFKQYGIDDAALDKAKKPAAPAAPTTTTPAASAGGGGIMDTITSGLEKAHKFTEDWDPLSQQNAGQSIGRGVAKAGVTLAHGAGALASQALPTAARKTLEQTFAQSPTMKQLSLFENSPSSGMIEDAANYATQGIGMMLGPGEARVGKAVADYLPTAAKTARKWVTRGVNAAEYAGRGALGGMIANPNDPTTGAETGAAAGLAGPIAGAALRSAPVRMIGKYALPEAAWWGIHKATGAPFWSGLGPLVAWQASPLGHRLSIIGNTIVDETGRVLGSIVTRADRAAAMRQRRWWGGTPGAPGSAAPGIPAARMPPVGSHTGIPSQAGGYAGESARQDLLGPSAPPISSRMPWGQEEIPDLGPPPPDEVPTTKSEPEPF